MISQNPNFKNMSTPPTSPLRKVLVYFLSTLLLFQTTSCRYFKYREVASDFAPSINHIGKIHKYFIVHEGETLYQLTEITADSTSLSGNLADTTRTVYYTPDRRRRFKKEEKDILQEVHIYLKNDAAALQTGPVAIPLTDLKELRIIELDSGATIASYVFSTFGIITGVFAILLIIVALTKSSCPYVYVNTGDAFLFAGETFGGAIAPNLSRDDYLPLPAIQPVRGTYQLRISNELKERQYTDLAELVVVNHAPTQTVLLDKYGEVQLLKNSQLPVRANSYQGDDLLPTLAGKDKAVFLFNDEGYSKNGINLVFDKPAAATSGKLVLKGKNTLWFDYLFGEFLGKFGTSYAHFMDKQSRIPSAERLQKVRENDFPLSIYIQQAGEWQLADEVMTVGPLADRELVIPLDLSSIAGETVAIKIETGFMFWELDYAALDFTDNQALEVTHWQPLRAFGTGQQDWTTALAATDEQYMAQEQVGEVTELVFPVPPVPAGQVQTVFLHTRGYYELIREFSGLPKIAELNKFKTPGYFSDFSRASYLRVLDQEERLAKVQ